MYVREFIGIITLDDDSRVRTYVRTDGRTDVRTCAAICATCVREGGSRIINVSDVSNFDIAMEATGQREWESILFYLFPSFE